jgi:moxR-like ATPase
MSFKLNETLKKSIIANLNSNVVPILIGEPAIGKSSFIESLGQELGSKTFTLQCNELSEKADLTGARTIPIDDKKTKFKQIFFPHADAMDAIEYALAHPDETVLLFMDEINRTNSDVTSALLSVPTRRKIGNVELPQNLKVIIAGNDKGNIVALDEASISRFVIYKVAPDVDTFLKHNQDINPLIEDLLLTERELIQCKPINLLKTDDDPDTDEDDQSYDMIMSMIDDDSMEQFTAPRTITALSKYLNSMSEDDLKQLEFETADIELRGDIKESTLLFESLIGHTGHTEFTIKLYNKINDQLRNIQTQNVRKPYGYDDFVEKPNLTTSEIQDYISKLSDDEKSQFLIYTLTDKENNVATLRTIIKEIAKSLSVLMPDYLNIYKSKHQEGSFNMQLNSYLRNTPELKSTTLVSYLLATTTD